MESNARGTTDFLGHIVRKQGHEKIVVIGKWKTKAKHHDNSQQNDRAYISTGKRLQKINDTELLKNMIANVRTGLCTQRKTTTATCS